MDMLMSEIEEVGKLEAEAALQQGQEEENPFGFDMGLG